MTNYTQESLLNLTTKVGLNRKSIIEEMYFTPPLKIIHPIYEGDLANIMLLSVSAGLMQGDKQKITLNIGRDCKIKLSSQSYEKIHNTEEGKASRETNIVLHSNALLNYTPLPTIAFANSTFENHTTITMAKDSVLYYSDIFCAGRVGRGELFAFNAFCSKLLIYKEGNLVFFDNTRLFPKRMDLKNCCMFDKYTHYLNLIIFDDNQDCDVLRDKVLQSKLNASLSTNQDNAIVIKALHTDAQALLEFKETLGL